VLLVLPIWRYAAWEDGLSCSIACLALLGPSVEDQTLEQLVLGKPSVNAVGIFKLKAI